MTGLRVDRLTSTRRVQTKRRLASIRINVELYPPAPLNNPEYGSLHTEHRQQHRTANKPCQSSRSYRMYRGYVYVRELRDQNAKRGVRGVRSSSQVKMPSSKAAFFRVCVRLTGWLPGWVSD